MKQSSQIFFLDFGRHGRSGDALKFAESVADNIDMPQDAPWSAEPLKKITVCSRHEVLVAGFRALIAEPAGMEVFECSDAAELCVELNPGRGGLARRKPPDLLLVDVDSLVTPHCLDELKTAAPDAGLILWVDWISPEFVREAIRSGVRGIIRKNAPAEVYAQCLGQVAAGQLWLENEMSQKVLAAKAVRLSPRERQLVGLLTEGLRNKEIAGRMNITEGTAKAYLSRLFEKTGASDRFELAMFALRNLETNPSAGPSRGPRIFLPLRAIFSRRA